jgi:hypothetical protein
LTCAATQRVTKFFSCRTRISTTHIKTINTLFARAAAAAASNNETRVNAA